MASYPALELRFAQPAGSGLQELLHAELDGFAAVAIEEGDGGARWRVFFRSADVRDAARDAIAARFGAQLASLDAIEVDDEDWARRSQAALTSIRIGRIVVSPPWDVPTAFDAWDPHKSDNAPVAAAAGAPEGERSDETITIVIEPSMGFGTGHHATTRLCLDLLQGIDVRGRRVLDVGTGSGVLAIAARLLGAADVLAIDNDPDAIQNARENIARNRVSDAVSANCADLAACSGPADIVVANLTGAVLQRHAPELTALVRPGGMLIVSGFGPDERDAVLRALGGRLQRECTEGDWVAALTVHP